MGMGGIVIFGSGVFVLPSQKSARIISKLNVRLFGGIVPVGIRKFFVRVNVGLKCSRQFGSVPPPSSLGVRLVLGYRL